MLICFCLFFFFLGGGGGGVRAHSCNNMEDKLCGHVVDCGIDCKLEKALRVAKSMQKF